MNSSEANGSSGEQSDVAVVRKRTQQSRVLLLLAVLSSGMLLCCCIPMVAFNVAFGPVVTLDPAQVKDVAREIIPIVVPKGFEGVESRTANNSLYVVRIARFNQKEGRGKLVVGQYRTVPEALGNENDPKMLQYLIEQMTPGIRVLDVKNRVEHELLIDGKKVMITVLDGVDVASSTRMRQVSGTWTAAGSVCQLMLQAESDFLTDEDTEGLIRSLSDPATAE